MKLQLSQVQLSWNSCDLTLKVSLLPSFKTSDFADTFLFGHFTSKSLCTWSLCSYCQAFYFRVVQTSTFILWHWSVTWSQGASYNLVWTASWFYTVGATRVAHTLLLSLRTACYCQHSRVYRSVIPYNHLKKKKKNHYKAGQALEQVAQGPKLEQSPEHLKFSTDLALRNKLN